MEREQFSRLETVLTRIAVANERLIELADQDRSYGDALSEQMGEVPTCPHCGTVDPHTESRPGSGKVSEFVLASPCGNCGRPLYAIPVGWKIVGDKEQARQLLERREDGNGRVEQYQRSD